ncbi:PREDICTED: protein trichome birefringence-like 14 isoform X1 [Populus euphratica]|uniref:Protein trichome birefringence-like 14 isoform X1 n=1 Tax=Populus euphratica TaxID=75702 RepID=A0AAJ6UJJ6_POPEU|nr:PREDICTED: protein trichome birefringence-like 14 isoform X1 [Populus euphratica]
MKGNFYRLKGRHVSVTLLVLTLTTIFLWAWEKNPFVTTLQSAQEQFNFHTSEFVVDAPKGPSFDSLTPNEHVQETDSNPTRSEESQIPEKEFDASNFTNSVVLETEDGDADRKPSSKIKEFVVDTPKGSSFDSLTPNEHVQETDSDPTRSEDSKIPEKEFDASNFTNSVVPEMKDGDADREPSSKIKDCNYSKGRWVADSRRPLYSGFECKQWLSEMWACRLTQRTDFSFEGYRWQPENCKMLEFERSVFLRRMQDRTIAFIGDSLGRQQFQSLLCMASGGEWREDIENVGKEYGLVKARGAIRPDGWAYRFSNTNTTILYYWSASLADLEPLNTTDKATDVAMHLDRAPAFMRRFLHRFDVLVLNTGHHWNRGKITGNRWVMYVNGKPLKDRKLLEIGNAKNFTVHSVARWLDSQLPSHPRLKAFFRTISPRHFRNGDWNTGGNCDNTTPLTGGSEISQDESSDPVIAAAVKGTNITLLDITALSELRDEGHISRYSVKATTGVNDCLHWCLPGIPDTWNELLIAQV